MWEMPTRPLTSNIAAAMAMSPRRPQRPMPLAVFVLWIRFITSLGFASPQGAADVAPLPDAGTPGDRGGGGQAVYSCWTTGLDNGPEHFGEGSGDIFFGLSMRYVSPLPQPLGCPNMGGRIRNLLGNVRAASLLVKRTSKSRRAFSSVRFSTEPNGRREPDRSAYPGGAGTCRNADVACPRHYADTDNGERSPASPHV